MPETLQQQQKAPEDSKKLSPYLFQNHVALYLELIENKKLWLTSIFGASLS